MVGSESGDDEINPEHVEDDSGDDITTEGELTGDETWSGVIEVGYVVVPEGITLTIEPGTVVKFRADRGYIDVNKGGLGVEGGTLKAIGTPDDQIFFTADHESAGFDYAINGDWFGISLFDTEDSELKYAVVEFAEIGVEQFDSAVPVSHSVIRWNNTEGLYAEQSSPVFTYNTLYQNGYHGIALEQFNEHVRIEHNLFQRGYVGVHSENSECAIQNNVFEDYQSHAITAGMDSDLTVTDNTLFHIEGDPAILNTEDPDDEHVGDDTVTQIERSGNEEVTEKPTPPDFDYLIPDDYDLGYKPASTEDEYLYVYDTEDITREVTHTWGEDSGLAFGWALHYYDGYLWRFSIGDGEYGDGLDFIRIDPDTDEVIKMATDFAVNPRGLTHDGEYFFVNDFSEKKLFWFKPPAEITPGAYVIFDESWSHDIPEPELGGTMGLTFDGTHLLLPSREQDKLYRLDPKNPGDDSCGEISLPEYLTLGNDITWHDGYLWSTASGYGLGKIEIDGNEANLVGSIYPVAYDAWAITSNGEGGENGRLWTLQKTCELWDDDKLFEIRVKQILPRQ
jgi:hypothetical protein